MAIAGEGILCRGGCVAGDLLKGENKIIVEAFSLVVVEGSEGREGQIGFRVVGNGVSSIIAEGEVVDDGAVAVWKKWLEMLIIRNEWRQMPC